MSNPGVSVAAPSCRLPVAKGVGEGLLATTLRHRPLVMAAICFSVGVLVADWRHAPSAFLALAVLLAAAGIRPERRLYALLAAFSAFTAAGALRQQVQQTPGPMDISRFAANAYVEVQGVAASAPEPRGTRFVTMLRARSLTDPDGVRHPCSGVAYASMVAPPNTALPVYGESLLVRGVLSGLPSPANPGAAPLGARLRRHGTFSMLTSRYPSSWTRIAPAGQSLFSRAMDRIVATALQMRLSLKTHFARTMTGEHAALLTGLVLGGHSDLSEQTREAFRRSGILHIVAASGANVAIVVSIVYFLAHLARLSAVLRAGLCLASAAAYAVAAGAEPAILRAVIMACVFVAAPLFGRDRDAPSALAVAALAALAYDPGSLLDTGFQLSFAIVAATIAYWPWWLSMQNRFLPPPTVRSGPARMARRAVRALAFTVGLSAIVGVASAPLTLQTFNRVSLVGVLSNALVAPAVAVLMPAALAGWCLCLVAPTAGALFCGLILAPMATYVMWVATHLGGLTWSALAGASPGWPAVGIAYITLGVLARWLHSTTRHASTPTAPSPMRSASRRRR